MSWMIVELVNDKRQVTSAIFDRNIKGSTDQRIVLPEPAAQIRCYQAVSGRKRESGARFPWIQRSESGPADFHSV